MVESKLGFLVSPRVNLRSNLVKVDENHQVSQVWCRNMKIFVFDFRLTQGWLGAFWSIWTEMTLRVLQCPNGLHHVNLDVFVARWKKFNIFRIFWVQHANWGWTKYGIYSNKWFNAWNENMIFGYLERLFWLPSKVKLWVQNWVSTQVS